MDESNKGRLVDKATLLKYLNQQPEQVYKALEIVDDAGEIKILKTCQNGNQPPVIHSSQK